MDRLAESITRVAAETGFAGVVRVDLGEEVLLDSAYGLADRRHGIPMATSNQLALASGAKTFTALTVMSLVQDGMLGLDTAARSLLGGDLPLIGADVTVEHLLAHRSGIGDYLDEDTDLDLDAYLMPVPVHELTSTESYLAALVGKPTKFPAGQRFSYCNSGYVVLALLCERAAGAPFHQLVSERVCQPAGMSDTAFLRSDALPGRAAVGYIDVADSLRTNVFHLPVLGSGDGGIYSTSADIRRLWLAVFAGEIVPPAAVREMTRPRSLVPGTIPRGYGLGFWLSATGDAVVLEGCDAGVSFHSAHHREIDLSWTVIGTTADNAWPIARLLSTELPAREGGRPA